MRLPAVAILFLLFFSSNLWAKEKLFTIFLEHYENPAASNKGIKADALEGRFWDIQGLLKSFSSNLEWISSETTKNLPHRGKSICLKIKDSADQDQNPLSLELRIRTLKNFLNQLRMRESEMRRAGATFQVVYPSDCAD